MLEQKTIQGSLPDLDPLAFVIHSDYREHLSEEAVAWLRWMVQARYAQLAGVSFQAEGANSLRMELWWDVPLEQVFAPTPLADDTATDRIMDQLVERVRHEDTDYYSREGNRMERIDYMPPSHSQWRSRIPITVQKPRHPARPRDAAWLASRMRSEMNKAGFEHKWPQAALKNWELWLKVDGKDVFIPRPRDLAEEPLPRRIKVRSNEQQTESSLGVDCPLCVNERMAARRRRLRIRRRT